MIKNDWLSKQIEMMSQALAVILFGKDAAYNFAVEEDEAQGGLEMDDDVLLSFMLRRLMDEGKINEAENLLFESIEGSASEGKLQIALAFYGQLDKMSDSFLSEHSFSREEILDGLSSVKEIYEQRQ